MPFCELFCEAFCESFCGSFVSPLVIPLSILFESFFVGRVVNPFCDLPPPTSLSPEGWSYRYVLHLCCVCVCLCMLCVCVCVCLCMCCECDVYVLEVGGLSQVCPDAQPGNRFVSFVRAGEARRGEAA